MSWRRGAPEGRCAPGWAVSLPFIFPRGRILDEHANLTKTMMCKQKAQ